jgi:uncharacterized membrane protein HdeD (DUF308 family)
MLRNFILALGGFAFVSGLIALFAGTFPPAFVLVFWGVLLIVGTVYERVRYKPVEAVAPAGNWVRTEERFIDDETGQPVTVYMDPETGERKYVHD